MTKLEKLKLRLLSNPKDFTFSELEKLLSQLGVEELNPKYALDFLLRVQTASKSIALLHLAQSP